MNILMVDPGKVFLEKKKGTPKVYPHIGLAYVATYLLESGFNVRCVDMAANKVDARGLREIIYNFKPDVVGITAVTFLAKDAYEVATFTKSVRRESTVVLGGAHATALPKKVMQQCADIDVVVCGEGEYSMKEIATLKKEGTLEEKLPEIKGIAYREGSKVLVNEPREFIEDLDSLPFPKWDLFDYEKYHKVYSERFGKEILLYQITGSRGCPYQCTFCFPLHGRRFRFRSAENIVQEVQIDHEKLRARHFDFTDSTATVLRKRSMKICELLIEIGLYDEVSWNIETRADLVDRELLRKTKKAGCEMILFGLESADDFVLRRMKKNISSKEVEKAVKTSVTEGLKVKLSVILGHPFETVESAFRTFEFVKKLRKEYGVIVSYNIIDVYPGTELYTMIDEKRGGARWIEGARNNWSSYDRTRPKIEVNDLTKEKIVQLYHRFEGELSKIPYRGFYKTANSGKDS